MIYTKLLAVSFPPILDFFIIVGTAVQHQAIAESNRLLILEGVVAQCIVFLTLKVVNTKRIRS